MYSDRPSLGFSDSSDEEGTRRRPRQRQTQSKEERMLGMWADDNDEYDGNSRYSGAAAASSADAGLLNPVGFVVAQDPSSDAHSVASDGMARNGASDSGGSGSSTSNSTDSDSDGGSDSDSPILAAKDTAPNLRSLPNKDFGKFASSAVWNMMTKMGYRPGEGLGKHGEGRIEPVQATARRAGEGISFSGSETPAASPRPSFRSKPTKPAAPRPAQRFATAYRKIEYKTLEDLENRTDAKMKEIFVDMTSDTTATSLAELLSNKLPQSEREQLISDTRLGLDLSFNRLEELNRERVVEESRSSALQKDIEALSRSIEQRSVRIEGFRSLDDSIASVRAASQAVQIDKQNTVQRNMAALYDTFAHLRTVASTIEKRCEFDVWRELRLERVVADGLYSHFQRVFRAWDPDSAPNLVKDLIDPVCTLVTTSNSELPADSMTPFESLLSKTLVPRLKQYVSTEWVSSSDTLAHILAQLPSVIAAEASASLGATLQRTVDGVNPRIAMGKYGQALAATSKASTLALEPLRFDHSVLPWLPFISDTSELLVSVRRKLCTMLDCWLPSKDNNDAIMALLAPWIELLRGKEQHKLATKVAERLNSMLEAEFSFSAQRQVVWPFKVLLKWHRIIPYRIWLLPVKRHVLQGFLDYLRLWLEDPDANYAEIADWYWQWKQMYPAAIFDSSDIQNAFREALVYMAFALS